MIPTRARVRHLCLWSAADLRRFAMAAALSIGMAAFAAAAQAEGERLRGAQFINVLNGNTIVGTDGKGMKFHAFFLTGGVATYEDANGNKDTGTWRVTEDDRICVTWRQLNGGAERCVIVKVDGRTITWKGNSVSGKGELYGTIAGGF